MSARGGRSTNTALTRAPRAAEGSSTSRPGSTTSSTSASTRSSSCRSRNSRPNSARVTTASIISRPSSSIRRRATRTSWPISARSTAALSAAGAFPLTLDQIRPGINQLKCLIDLAHLKGLAVVFDLVYNHAGGGFDDHSLYFYDRLAHGDQNDSLYFTDEGWAGGLVFAYWNANVRQFLIDNASAFLKEYRIDGVRYDEVRVISNNRPGGVELCQDITSTLRFIRPSAIQIAEYWDWDRAFPVTPTPGGLGFDAALGDGFRDAARGVLTQAAGGEGAELRLDPVASALYPTAGCDEAWRLVQCLENHDLTYAGHDGAARVAFLADPADRDSWYARSRARAATALLFAAPGIPALFMGQEAGGQAVVG